MAILYIDGFDHYSDTANVANRITTLDPVHWTYAGADTTIDNSIVCATMPGGLGGLGYQSQWNIRNSAFSGGTGGARYKLPKTISEGTVLGWGAHLYLETIPSDANSCGLYAISDASSLNSSGNLTIAIDTSGHIQLKSGSVSGTTLGTSTNSLNANQLYHVEIKIKFSDTVGTFEVRVDGISWLSLTGKDTLPTNRTHLIFFPNNGDTTNTNLVHLDNFFVWDDSGSLDNDFCGEQQVFTIFPDSDGTVGWTLSTGTDAFDILDDVPPDSDYITATDPDTSATFGLADLPSANINVKAIQTNVQGYKTGSGGADLTFGPSNDQGSGQTLSATTLYYTTVSDTNPDTSSRWTSSDVNNMTLKIVKSA